MYVSSQVLMINVDQLSRKPVGAKLARDWARSVDNGFGWSTAIASKLCSHRFAPSELLADRQWIGGRLCCECCALERQPGRSEEHTSELQSLMRSSYAVFCFKNQKTNN